MSSERDTLHDDEAPSGKLPRRFGRFEVLMRLGSGGMASVYLARTKAMGGFERFVAVKVMHPFLASVPSAADSFLAEAKLSARIYHPNVVSVTDIGRDDAGLFLVMEYVEGDSLWALMTSAIENSSPIPRHVGLRILCDALLGLHAAHELRGDSGEHLELVHRDFSPHNILVGIDGVARLTDFGVAKCADAASMTETGLVKGKVSYMSPEQARGLPLDRRSDVWAAGVVAWELLTNRRLHKGSNEASKLLEVVSGEILPPNAVRSDVSASLSGVVMQALCRDLDLRTPTAAAFAERLATAWGDELADHAEVAEYMARTLGASIAQRRRKLEVVSAGNIVHTVPIRKAADGLDTRASQTAATSVTQTVHLSSASVSVPLKRTRMAIPLVGVVAILGVAGALFVSKGHPVVGVPLSEEAVPVSASAALPPTPASAVQATNHPLTPTAVPSSPVPTTSATIRPSVRDLASARPSKAKPKSTAKPPAAPALLRDPLEGQP